MTSRPEEWEAEESTLSPVEMAIVRKFADSGYDLSRVRQAAIDSGVDPRRATDSAARALKKISNNPLFQKALKKQGVTMETMAKKLAELLEAKHPRFPDQKDNLIQLKALDMAMKASEIYPSTKIELESNSTQQIIISAEVIGAVERAKGIKVIDIEPERPKGNF